jgi:hypothetical protein
MTVDLLTRSYEDPKGRTEARVFTLPLRDLNENTSYGFRVIRFARDVLKEPLDPWQEWLVIHAGELLEDGRPRFRRVLVLVARQNGKTHLAKVLNLFWLFEEAWPKMLLTSTNLRMAAELFEFIEFAALGSEELLARLPDERAHGIRHANGDARIRTLTGSTVTYAAANQSGGRGMSIDRLTCDELRQHKKWDAYNAAYKAMAARPNGQAWFTSNAGGEESIVLNSLHKDALLGLDRRLGIFEWSAPDGCDVMDPDGWAYANPNLGHRLDVDSIAGEAALAKKNGGETEAGFRTETLCQRVNKMNAAIDPTRWKESVGPADMRPMRSRLALCLDISPDNQHVTLCAAGRVSESVTRVAILESWDGPNATAELRDRLNGILATTRPLMFGWFPGGPAAALTAELRNSGRIKFPRSVKVEEMKGDTPAVCMGFAEQVRTGAVEHPDDELLNSHVLNAEKLGSGDRWVFSRKGDGHCDAAYAAAGAVHLARMLPAALSMNTPLAADIADEFEKMQLEKEEHDTEL